jgi:peroxiredoxin (alkyl hydroperoxide reductase subunit C)
MKKNVSFILAMIMVTTVFAEGNKIPLIGSKAPEFSTNTTNGKLNFPSDFGKSWKILFSHPADFTPVCSTELLELAYLQPEFERLGVKVAVISTDDVQMHVMWKNQLEELNYKDRGQQSIKFPLLEDKNGTASKLYGMLHEPVSTNRDIRGVFIIDSENVVRSINFYPMQVGRNMTEIVRIVEALQTADKSHVLTPANWNEGEDVMVPHYPYTPEELADNPNIKDDYYSLGNRIWFKKTVNK